MNKNELKAKYKQRMNYNQREIVEQIIDESFKAGQDDRQKEFDKTLLKVFKKKIKGATTEELDQAKLFIDAVDQAKSEERERIVKIIDDEKERTKKEILTTKHPDRARDYIEVLERLLEELKSEVDKT